LFNFNVLGTVRMVEKCVFAISGGRFKLLMEEENIMDTTLLLELPIMAFKDIW